MNFSHRSTNSTSNYTGIGENAVSIEPSRFRKPTHDTFQWKNHRKTRV